MSVMCMVKARSRCRIEGVFRLVMVAVLVLLVGCSPSADERPVVKCDASAADIIKAIADDRDFDKYAGDHFQAKRVVVLWHLAPSGYKQCGEENSQYRFVKSIVEFDRNSNVLVVDKMYFDDDAAFVELRFPPTGKNGAAFLRKRAGKWVVTQSTLWEI